MQPVALVKAKPQTPLCNAIAALLWKLSFHMAHDQHNLLDDREIHARAGAPAYPYHTSLGTCCMRTELRTSKWGQPNSARDMAQKSKHGTVQDSTKNHLPTLIPEHLMASGNTFFWLFSKARITVLKYCLIVLFNFNGKALSKLLQGENSVGALVCFSGQTWSLGALSQSNWTDQKKKKIEKKPNTS